MSRHLHPDTDPMVEFPCPFGNIDGLDRDDFHEIACKIFFTSCRSSPVFGGRSKKTSGDEIAPAKWSGVGMAATSRVKSFLGLKMMKTRRLSTGGMNPTTGSNPGMVFTSSQAARVQRRPMTSAEIMRQQMRMKEESDNRLRKTLTRTLAGQINRRAEMIILPLELLRHVRPSEFNDSQEYHQWQKRQLKILEAGLLIQPSIPLDKSETLVGKLRDIVQASETKAIDTTKSSETMKNLCNCVVSLASRSPNGGTTDVCHWADGYPLNVNIYIALLYSIFDIKNETLVLDEVDELLELMKKTWPTLGINRSLHNLCFFWVLFEHYVMTGQVEPELLGASITMLNEVANDAKQVDKEPVYVNMLGCCLCAITKWCDKRLLDYHENFDRGNIGLMENIIPLVLMSTKIFEEDVPSYVRVPQEMGEMADTNGNRVDQYIRSSSRNAFAKILEDQNVNLKNQESQQVSEILMKLARQTEELAAKEKDIFSPILKKWHQIPAGIAASTLHTCYGTLLERYLTSTSSLTKDTILVLQTAGKLEKVLIQMVVDESVECEDGGKSILKEMSLYEIDSIISRLLKQWVQEKLKKGKEDIQKSRDIETWNPKFETEPYANSALELVRFAKETVESFFEIPAYVSENLVHDLADGIEHIFQDYVTFVASCGSKQSYLPILPPLTRCSRGSKFIKLWKKAGCSVGTEDSNHSISCEENHSNPCTSRGTHRLYIRLNTLHYLLSELHTLDKTLSLSPKVTPSSDTRFGKGNKQLGTSYFEHCQSTIQVASQHVSEVAAYRLLFLDLNSVFYGGIYVGDVANARISLALRMLKQNLEFLCEVVDEGAHILALREAMKASFEAFLMVLLAGGNSRAFSRSDHLIIQEDFGNLKRVLYTCGEGVMVEDVVEREAEIVEAVVALMSESTEQLIEDFCIVACEASGIGFVVEGQKLPMPTTTGKWNRSDPNTILRVLCHRNDEAANHFLKKTFQLAKRRGSRMV